MVTAVRREHRVVDDLTALYRFYDGDDRLLYVGIAVEPFRRMAQHRHGKGWWSDVARVELERFDTRAQAAEAERLAIANEQPLYNVVHNRPPLVERITVALYCQVCDQRIEANAGYLCVDVSAAGDAHRRLLAANRPSTIGVELDLEALLAIDDVPWEAFHAACDPEPDRNDYWIGSERIATIAQLLHWNDHLLGKGWVLEATNWTEMLDLASNGHGPLRIESNTP